MPCVTAPCRETTNRNITLATVSNSCKQEFNLKITRQISSPMVKKEARCHLFYDYTLLSVPDKRGVSGQKPENAGLPDPTK